MGIFSNNSDFIKCELDSVFFDSFSGVGQAKYRSPFTVSTGWYDDTHVYVSAYGFYKLIRAKDNIFDILFGTSWEGRVRKAQRDAFKVAYKEVRDEEMRNYKIGKLT